MKKLTCCEEFEMFLLEHRAELLIKYKKDDDEKIHTCSVFGCLVDSLMASILKRDEELREILLGKNEEETNRVLDESNIAIRNLSISYINGGQLIGDKYKIDISFDLDPSVIGQYIEGDNVVIDSFCLMMMEPQFKDLDFEGKEEHSSVMPVKVLSNNYRIKSNGVVSPFIEHVVLSIPIDDFVKHNPAITFSTIMKMKALCLGRKACEELVNAYKETKDVTLLPNCSEVFVDTVNDLIDMEYDW